MNAKNIFGAICVAIALFFLWPAVFGSWAEVSALKTAVQEREELIQQRDQILKDATAQYETYAEVKKGTAATVFSSFVPVRKNEAELVSAASTIATTSGLQLKTIQVTDTTTAKSKEAYGTVSLKLELSGQYDGLRAFLRDLESYVRILNVRKIEIGQGQQEGGMGYSIEAETYYIK